MSCKHLQYGWRTENGIIYKDPLRKHGEPVCRPCGICIDCRLDYSRQWAIRCKHEASLHEKNCVVTLTYSDENIPKGWWDKSDEKKPKWVEAPGTIDPDAGPAWMKRLRAKIQYEREQLHKPWNPKDAIKTYGCAEYGCNDPKCGRPWCGHNMRPHYHIILFNYDFPDKKVTQTTQGRNYYTSQILEQTWGLGGCQIMDMNFETAAYVSRYVTKKLSGPNWEKYESERIKRGKQKHAYGAKLKEQSICIAQQTGIASEWWKINKEKIHSNDLMYVNGQKIKPVKYYDHKYEIEKPNEYEKIKQKRKKEIQKYIDETDQRMANGDATNYWKRLSRQRAHERCMAAKLKLLKRDAL